MDSIYIAVIILIIVSAALYFLGFMLALGVVQMLKKRPEVTARDVAKSLAWPFNTARGIIEDWFS